MEAAACAQAGSSGRRAWSGGGGDTRLGPGRPAPISRGRAQGSRGLACRPRAPWWSPATPPVPLGASSTAAAGGKEPELGADRQTECGRRSVEEAAPPLRALRAIADRGVAGRGARRAEASGAWPAVRSRFGNVSGKLRESCLAVGAGVEMPSVCIQERLESRAVSFAPLSWLRGAGAKECKGSSGVRHCEHDRIFGYDFSLFTRWKVFGDRTSGSRFKSAKWQPHTQVIALSADLKSEDVRPWSAGQPAILKCC